MFGKLDGLDVAAMAGRVHLYEGYSAAQVAFGVRVLGSLGVRSMVFTNAAGGINLKLERGGLVLISDHINLQGANPLVGPNDDRARAAVSGYVGGLFGRVARNRAGGRRESLVFRSREGVYAAMLGPSYETPAEIRLPARPSARTWSACPRCPK